MARKNKKSEPAPVRKNKVQITLARKAKRVIQSNGLQYFLKWADQSFTGGLRRKATRDKFKLEKPKLYKELVSKYAKLKRKMDRPKPKEDEE